MISTVYWTFIAFKKHTGWAQKNGPPTPTFWSIDYILASNASMFMHELFILNLFFKEGKICPYRSIQIELTDQNVFLVISKLLCF